MNFRFRTLFKITGMLLVITGVAMVPSMICALWIGDSHTARVFGITGAVSVGLGLILFFTIAPSKRGLSTRDGYLAVFVSWMVCCLFGAVPYLATGSAASFIDALFESVAAYTTTGATVTTESFSLPLILWKAVCHWLGGMGILVFIISILPALGSGGQRIASAEAPGPGLIKLAPRMQDYSRLLYAIYITLTGLETLLLWASHKMGLVEAMINAMGSISTAGLFLHGGSVAYYDSIYVEVVISAFTIASSVNFIMYLYFVRRNYDSLIKNMEVRIYLLIIAIGTILASLSLWVSHTYPSFGSALRHGFFQVTSFATTSGFVSDDYTGWPVLCLSIFFLLLFIGGCAASTAGSVKVIRIIILFKLVARGFYRRIHPRSVRAIRLGETVISAQMASTVTAFILIYGVTYVLSAIVLSLQGLSLETTLSATASLMSTTGISFGDIGAQGYYGMFHPVLKLFMSILMVTGRLELMTVLILLFPSFWNPDRAQTNR